MKKRIAVAIVTLVAALGVYLVGDYVLSADFQTYGSTLKVRSLVGSFETDSFTTYTPALCERLPKRAYVSGLIFNPKDRQTFYVRANCYYEAALRDTNPALCAQVRQRWHLFLGGGYYTEAGCRAAVAAKTR
ncbi:MAG TPA: hypothetical protein VJR92_07075 [Gemmatimonadaceae bacterium]|nr:hypothetical protein [Gemmatimonadaceae bacterium]